MDAAAATSTVLTIVYAVLSYFVLTALANILSDVSLLQVVVNLSTMSLAMPAVLSIFMSDLIQVVTSDVFPTDYIYNFVLGPDDTSALSDNFDFTGYSTSQFIRLLGSVFILTTLKVL